MKSYRCSQLPRLLSCPASQLEPAIDIQGDDQPARVGNAVHAALAGLFKGAGNDLDALTFDAAQAEGVDADEVRPLVGLAVREWSSLLQLFPQPRVEVELLPWQNGMVQLTGHCDLIAELDDEIRILDWKSGRVDRDAEHQMRGYALLAISTRRPPPGKVVACKVNIRTGDRFWYHWRTQDILAWWSEALATLTRITKYAPSQENCVYCPRRLECPARETELASLIRTFGVGGGAIGEKFPDDLASILEKARSLQKLASDAVESIKIEVLAGGGVMQLSDGRQLAVKEIIKRKICELPIAREILGQFIDEQALDRCTSISKTAAEREIRDVAPPREKGRLAKAAMEQLDKAGCFRSDVSQRLEITWPLQPVIERKDNG